jgi:hypothetical protein
MNLPPARRMTTGLRAACAKRSPRDDSAEQRIQLRNINSLV